ncbi:MAG: hypothetical protein V3U09_07495 [Thermoplasmata archaeon]
MFNDKEELDAHINKRLEFYKEWDERDEPAYCVKQVVRRVRYGHRCEGVMEALCTNFMGDAEQEDLYRILDDWDKDLKEAYEMIMEAIEAYCKGRRVYNPE